MGTSFQSVPLRFLMATKHLALAHFCDELNRPEQAVREIQEAEKQCHDQDGIPHPYLHKFIRLCKLKIDAASIDMVDTKAIMEIANCAAAEGFYRAEWLALGMVAAKNAALSLRQRNFAIRERQHTELCMRMENILSELGNIHQLCQTALLNHNFYDAKYCESLEWWKNFDVLHPRYNIWQHRINRQIMLSTLHVNLEDFVPALEARQRAEDLLEECKDFWKPCRLESQQGISFLASKSNAHSQSRQRQMLRKSEITQKFFFEDYENRHLTIPDPDSGQLYYGTLGVHVIGTRQAPFEALLDWLSADMQTGELMPAQLGIILGLPLGNFTIDECRRHLEHTSSRHLIALLYGPLDDPVPCERWQSTFDALRSWLDKTQSFPEIQQQFMLLEVQKTRIERSQRQAIQQFAECRRGLNMLNSIAYADDLKDNVRLLRIAWQSSFAMAVASSWLRASVWTGKMEEDFTEALVVLKQALADVQVSDPSPHAGFPGIDEFLRGVKYFALGQLYVSKFEAGGGVDSEPALASLRFAESCFRKKRKASSSKHGFTAVKRYLKALEQPMVQQIFPMAIRMQSTAHGAGLHADRIWQWIQTAKCRGLGSLGRFATLDHRYTESFLNSGADDGEGFETEDLRRLSLEAKTSVVFIDWYTNFLNAEIGVPIMLAWRAGGAVRIFKFGDDVDALDLTVYKRQFLSALERQETCEHDQTRKPAYWLQKFEGLVKPILEISEPGDVLVFSPCGLLHGVPLHAIIFDGQPLIGRNPITYTTSMKSLFYAAVAREIDTRKDEPSTFLPGVFGYTPSEQGRESVEHVADILNVRPNTDTDFTKGAFMTGLVKDIDLLHYHAHATAENGEPLEQALQFQDGLLTVEDILDIAPKTGSYHATILGCRSGVTVKTTSNEPLGLVPALMYNGASSVISALWTIEDHDAALFANEFYSDFASHQRDNDLHVDEAATPDAQSQTRMINLALATQRAVLRILHSEDGRGALKHWAGFVLNGWWMLEVPEKKQKKPPDLDKFPVMYSARPWPPPPPAPPVRIRSWLLMVPRWFSFYTLWPYFWW